MTYLDLSHAARTAADAKTIDECETCGHMWHGLTCIRSAGPAYVTWGVPNGAACGCPGPFAD